MEDILTTMRRLADENEVAGLDGHFELGREVMKVLAYEMSRLQPVETNDVDFQSDEIKFNGIKVVENKSSGYPYAVSWVSQVNFVLERPQCNGVLIEVSP